MPILVVATCLGPPKIYPCIGVVINGNYLLSPPWKELSWIGVGHPTSFQSAHRIRPMPLGRISNPVERNIHSRALSWNMLEEKRTQNTAETEVPYPAYLTLTGLVFHVAQYCRTPVIDCESHALHCIEHQRP